MKGTPSTVMQVLKQKVSREVRRRRWKAAFAGQLCLNFGNSPAELPQFWHPSTVRAGRQFYDSNVWSAKKRSEKLEYMHSNPVERGLVARSNDWAWSSATAYSGKGPELLSIDFR